MTFVCNEFIKNFIKKLPNELRILLLFTDERCVVVVKICGRKVTYEESEKLL